MAGADGLSLHTHKVYSKDKDRNLYLNLNVNYCVVSIALGALQDNIWQIFIPTVKKA